MKHLLPGVLALLFSLTGAFAQRVVENPTYKARNSPTVDVAKIELRDTATVIYCDVTYPSKWWIRLPSTTYIQSADGGEQLSITGSEGIKIDEQFWMPESGKASYVLHFPPIDPSTSAIDLIECPGANCFNIYDISLRELKSKKAIPASLEGDWFAVSGRGAWSYGFYDRFAVYENNFWDYGPIRQKGKITEITLVKGSQSKTLYAKAAKNGRLLMGTDKKQLSPYSREKLSSPTYDYSSEKGFLEPLVRKGDAVIRGFIKGYSPKMELKEGSAKVQSVFSWEGTDYNFKVDKNGRFEVTVPLEYPGNVLINLDGARPSVFVEPGSENLFVFELDEFRRAYRTGQDYSNREKTSLFMGDCASINADLQRSVDILDFEEERIMGEIAELSPEQYKADIQRQLKEKRELLKAYKEDQRISLKASQYLENTLDLTAMSELLGYNMTRRSAHFRSQRDLADSLRTPFKEVELDLAYYDFMKDLKVDYQMGLLVDRYDYFINMLTYFRSVDLTPNSADMDSMEELLKAKGVNLSPEELEMKGAVASLESKTAIEREAILDKYGSLMRSFATKYSSIIGPFMEERQTEARIKAIKEYLGVEEGLVTDIIRAQCKVKLMEQYYVAMSAEELQAFDEKVGAQLVKDYVHNYNSKVLKELAEEKDMSGVVINKAPAVEEEKLFQSMMEKYKGKVVYVDFWATWCGPCMGEMPHSKNLKNELKGKDVVFVYLTNESSPLKTWKNKIPEIKGEHFRLSANEWEYLTNKFNVQGIPRYMLVDQEGQIVSDDATRPSQKDKILGEISELLDKSK